MQGPEGATSCYHFRLPAPDPQAMVWNLQLVPMISKPVKHLIMLGKLGKIILPEICRSNPFFFAAILTLSFPGCNRVADSDIRDDEDCNLVQEYGPQGVIEIKTETVVTGLEVPWSIAFLPNGDALVTEREGRLRLVTGIYNDPRLVPQPVATLEVGPSSEGGLMGIELHPDFIKNRLFYLVVTVLREEDMINRIERWELSEDGTTARQESIIYDEIRAGNIHNGGRIKFGPDGMLYAGTGEAGDPDLSQDPESPNGKLLRLTPEGEIPNDNPRSGSPVLISGIRNTQGWDWPDENDAATFWLVDHGPSGEMGRFGHDQVYVARAGDNLGWPDVYGCEVMEGFRAPVHVWEPAVPPGGAAIYRGDAIPEWEGDLIIGTLRSRHLHRIVIEDGLTREHEVYLEEDYGRLREVIMGGDGELYITTSNCDGRGTCPDEQDMIIRVTR